MSSRARLFLYLSVLLVVSSFVNFHRLGERAFYGDEAIYASVTKNMAESGDWLHLYTYDPDKAYASKPPFYFWLTALVKGFIEDGELAGRWWSAFFGVGSVLLTCVLGSLLFSAETGFAAALLLATNVRFLIAHGARHGTMDSAVTCLALAAMILAWTALDARRPALNWIGIGVATGLISITKGLPPGLLVLGLLSLSWMFLRPARGWRRFALPAAAGLAALPIVMPWLIFQWTHHGTFLEQVYFHAFMGTLDPDHLRGPWFYLRVVAFSSGLFVYSIPAAILAVFFWFRGTKRREYTALAIFAVGWIAIFSLARAKLAWYVFPAFPAIALTMASVGVYPLQTALDRRLVSRRGRRIVALGLAVLALGAVTPEFLRIVTRVIPERIGTFRDLRWEVYQSANIAQHPEIPFVILDHPEQRDDEFWRHYERFEIDGETRTADVELVLRLVAEDGPIVVGASSSAPASLIRLLHSRFEGEGFRYQNRFHVVFVRGLELELPDSITLSAERCGPLDPALSEFERNPPAIHFGSGWSDMARGGRWSLGETAAIDFTLETARPLTLWLRGRTYRRQRVELQLNGHELPPILGDGKARTYERRLPEAFLAQQNELVLRLPDAARPDHDEADPPRLLGIQIQSLRLSEDRLID